MKGPDFADQIRLLFERFRKEAADLYFCLRLRHPYDRLFIPQQDDDESVSESDIRRAARGLEYRVKAYAFIGVITLQRYFDMMELIRHAELDALTGLSVSKKAVSLWSSARQFWMRFIVPTSIALGVVLYAVSLGLAHVLVQPMLQDLAASTLWASVVTAMLIATRKLLANLSWTQVWLLLLSPLMLLSVILRAIPAAWTDRFVQPLFYPILPYILSALAVIFVFRSAKALPSSQASSSGKPKVSEMLALPALNSEVEAMRPLVNRRLRSLIAVGSLLVVTAWSLGLVEYKTTIDRDFAKREARIQELERESTELAKQLDEANRANERLKDDFERLRDGDPIDPARPSK